MQLPDEIKEVRRLGLRPGDTLVLRCSRMMPPQVHDLMVEQARGLLGDHKVVVLGPGVDLEVLREVPESELPDYGTPLFDAIWNAIKAWDLQRKPGRGYAHATGDDVQTIVDAVKAVA